MRYVLTGDQQRAAAKRVGELLRQVGLAEFPYDPERFLDDIQSLIERGRLVTVMIIEVIYGLVFDAMIKAGHYDWVNPNITETNFQSRQTGSVKYRAVLVHLRHSVSTKEAEAEIKKLGLVPASLTELCAFGAKYPDEQKKYSIVAFGQYWIDEDNNLYFPYLCNAIRGRCLSLARGIGGWYGGCRFLALSDITLVDDLEIVESKKR